MRVLALNLQWSLIAQLLCFLCAEEETEDRRDRQRRGCKKMAKIVRAIKVESESQMGN